MSKIDVAIIGAGQAGLAMSHCLASRGIGHILFERGRIAERWRSAAWDSLRTLTPNWMTRLPGFTYRGGDPDGYMTRAELVGFFEGYAASIQAPVLEATQVLGVEAVPQGYRVTTSRGVWTARAVVIATGHCDLPLIPPFARALDGVRQIHSSQYRSPDFIVPGNVVVAGASSSGAQIARELQRAGRQVILSAGKHIRLPRLYRERDIFWWLQRAGLLDQALSDVADPAAAQRQPSLQLAGTPERADLDLAALQDDGVRITGRIRAAAGDRVSFAPDLRHSIEAAEAKQTRLLEQFGALAETDPTLSRIPAEPVRPVAVPDYPGEISLKGEGVGTVIWATGYRRAFPWLRLPVIGADGEIAHRGGVTALPGVYALGFRFLRKRDSSFIGGVGADAIALSDHIAEHLGRSAALAA